MYRKTSSWLWQDAAAVQRALQWSGLNRRSNSGATLGRSQMQHHLLLLGICTYWYSGFHHWPPLVETCWKCNCIRQIPGWNPGPALLSHHLGTTYAIISTAHTQGVRSRGIPNHAIALLWSDDPTCITRHKLSQPLARPRALWSRQVQACPKNSRVQGLVVLKQCPSCQSVSNWYQSHDFMRCR